MKLTLGFSPCPNDTFIFDALVNKKIDTGGFDFDVILEDVQTLNTWAKQGKLDVSKISYGVLSLILGKYVLLNSGGALGNGVGPLLIAKSEIDQSKIENLKIAIPGENTTAHLLFNLAFPATKNKQFMIFHEVEDAVINNHVDAGVIIHENRFTYQQKGLKKIIDLGEFWETKTGVPIPLGGIVAKRSLDIEVIHKIDSLIKQSLGFAFANYPTITPYVKYHSQEMSEDVMRQHIDLYVNDYSLDLGKNGRSAVQTLLDIASGKPLPDIFAF
jgi:1,4-dihydroxy-6-naphthoate synthase